MHITRHTARHPRLDWVVFILLPLLLAAPRVARAEADAIAAMVARVSPAVDPVGTAADSGIQKGDIIVRVQDAKITEPDQALRAFWARSSLRQRFAAVLVERDDKRFRLSLAIPR